MATEHTFVGPQIIVSMCYEVCLKNCPILVSEGPVSQLWPICCCFVGDFWLELKR